MAKLTHRIELTIYDRDLILKYGYVSGRLEASLRRWPKADGSPCGHGSGGASLVDQRPNSQLQQR